MVPSQEISNGVYTATTIAHSEMPSIRVINTNNNFQKIRNKNFNTEDVSKYNVFTVSNEKSSEKRAEKLMKILRNAIPNFVKSEMTELCTEFADIFALETDKLTVNNFYKQTLRTIDSEPVYSRN